MRRFTAVGAVVTLVDIAVVLALRGVFGLPVIAADAIAIAAAAALSFSLRRLDQPGPYLRATFAAGLLDIVVLRVGVEALPLLPAKLIALSAAALVRLLLYRGLSRPQIRTHQALRTDRPPPPGDVRFSVVVPAYKEGPRIAGTVARLRDALEGIETEIVVVDDGSGDSTADAARAAGADQVVVQPVNKGKGAAVRAGVLAARGRTIAFTDADLAYPPAQLARLLHEAEAGWDMVVGSRRHVDTTTLVRARRVRELSGRLFNLFTLIALLGQYRDTQCGLKAFRSDAARRLFGAARVDGFAFDVELFHLAERYRLSLEEVPVELANTETSTVRVGVDAVRMVRDLIRIRALASSGSYDEHRR
ncbi:MAG TPA: glycosyltransferase [Acidimicrobiales bacterium]|nr:glycosyltransferase [Acidimicrobiales bacterium]